MLCGGQLRILEVSGCLLAFPAGRSLSFEADAQRRVQGRAADRRSVLWNAELGVCLQRGVNIVKSPVGNVFAASNQIVRRHWNARMTAFPFSGARLGPLQQVVMPRDYNLLLAGYCQECFGVGMCNCQQRPCRAARLLAPLFPALQCTHRHTQQGSELRLGQPGAFTCLSGC